MTPLTPLSLPTSPDGTPSSGKSNKARRASAELDSLSAAGDSGNEDPSHARLISMVSPRASKEELRSNLRRPTKDDSGKRKRSGTGSRFVSTMLTSLRRGTVSSPHDTTSPPLSVSEPKTKQGTPTCDDRFAHQKKLREMLAQQNDDGSPTIGDAGPTGSYSNVARPPDHVSPSATTSAALMSSLAQKPARRVTTTSGGTAPNGSMPNSPVGTPRLQRGRSHLSQSYLPIEGLDGLSSALSSASVAAVASSPSTATSSPIGASPAPHTPGSTSSTSAPSSLSSHEPVLENVVHAESASPAVDSPAALQVVASPASGAAARTESADYRPGNVTGTEAEIPFEVGDRAYVHMGVVDSLLRLFESKYPWFEQNWKALDDDERKWLVLELNTSSRNTLLRSHAHATVCIASLYQLQAFNQLNLLNLFIR